jgi:hypothetical protein
MTKRRRSEGRPAALAGVGVVGNTLVHFAGRESMRQRRRRSSASFIAACCALGLLLSAATAAAEITSVTIDSVATLPGHSGYVYLEATMNGTVARDDGSVGEYSVPLVLKYPIAGGNGVGVVDWVNSSRLQNEGWIEDEFRIGQILLTTAGDYLFEEGYTYAAVQWSKSVTELFGPTRPDDGRPYNHLAYGTIERGADAWEILRDAARLLKDPGARWASGYGGMWSAPEAVEVALSAGYSQTGALQMGFLAEGQNVRGGEVVYDGHLIAKMGYICPQLDDVPPDFGVIPQPCLSSPSGDPSRVIHVVAQGDVEAMFMAALTRFPDDPNWRQYELAGVAHIPPSIIDLGADQNPIESAPVIRGALRSLERWITQGIPAPPSRFLAGPIDDEGNLRTELDTDGNARGGLRLPHMEQVIDGHPAGAPLGTYTGIDPAGESPYGPFGGTFSPYADEEICERYPDPGVYVDRVTRAADRLLADGYIVQADRDAYVSAPGGHLLLERGLTGDTLRCPPGESCCASLSRGREPGSRPGALPLHDPGRAYPDRIRRGEPR